MCGRVDAGGETRDHREALRHQVVRDERGEVQCGRRRLPRSDDRHAGVLSQQAAFVEQERGCLTDVQQPGRVVVVKNGHEPKTLLSPSGNVCCGFNELRLVERQVDERVLVGGMEDGFGAPFVGHLGSQLAPAGATRPCPQQRE